MNLFKKKKSEINKQIDIDNINDYHWFIIVTKYIQKCMADSSYIGKPYLIPHNFITHPISHHNPHPTYKIEGIQIQCHVNVEPMYRLEGICIYQKK